MAERFVTQWEKFLVAVPASTFRRGLGDTELIGTSTLPNRAIHRGIMKPFSTSIATVFEAYAGSLIRITGGLHGMVHVQSAPAPQAFSIALLLRR